MQVANDFDFRRLGESVIEWHDLSLIVERSERDSSSRRDVDEPVEVKDAIFGRHVERAVGENHLHVRIENAMIVGELETPRVRERLAAPSVRQPGEDSAYAASC